MPKGINIMPWPSDNNNQAKDTKIESKSLKGTFINAFILFSLDALLFNQGVIAGIVLLVVIIYFFPIAIILLVKIQSAKHLFNKCIIYTLMAIAVFVTNYGNNRLAKHRAAELVTVIEQYKNDNGIYPSKLDALIPEYIESIPLAKYTFGFNYFTYLNFDNDNKPIFYYVDFPPFGRPTYNFTSKEWDYLD
jgi:hypothetical protein